MKTFKVDIHPKLRNIEVVVKNGAAFTRDSIRGTYKYHSFTTNWYDSARLKEFAIKYGNDNNSNKGAWYAHCNGFAMDLMVDHKGNLMINTYKPYSRAEAPEKTTIPKLYTID
jgi:hypothetical protein